VCGNKAAIFHQRPVNIKEPFIVNYGVDCTGKSTLILTLIKHDKGCVDKQRQNTAKIHLYTLLNFTTLSSVVRWEFIYAILFKHELRKLGSVALCQKNQ
jgi:hypothetical protein